VNRSRGWTLFVIAVAIAAAIFYGLAPRPVLVDTERVSRGPLRVTVEEEGRTRVIDRYLISAPVAGFARRLNSHVGDAVKAGAILLRLDPLRSQVLDPRSRAEAQARAAAARAALQAAEERTEVASADAAYWEGELARIRELHESGTVSQVARDQAEADARKANATLRSANFQVEVARYELEATETALRYSAAQDAGRPAETVAIRSPVSGHVLKVIHESEGVVEVAEPLLEVGDPRALEIEVEVLSQDAVQIRSGTRVLLERWGGGEPLEGRVRLVEPVAFTKVSALGVEEQRVLVIVDIASPSQEWERLGDQYRVEASFVLWEGDDVLQVASSALFRHEGGWAVFAVENGTARLRPVVVGHRSGLSAEVVSGISEGETVVAHPDDNIVGGRSITTRRE
jgi:HlyD family secretion protein